MANCYKKLYVHLVFAVKHREALLNEKWRDQVFSYLSGILKMRGHYPLAVGGHIDHVHLLFDYSLMELIPDLVRELKKSSTTYIMSKKYISGQFNWQSGYGVFSVGWKEKDKMINYIMNQDEHHKTRTFREEYLALLKRFEVEYKNEYVFDFLF